MPVQLMVVPDPIPREKTDSRDSLPLERRFTTRGVDPIDTVEWVCRDAVITDERGQAVFEQRGVEVPKAWSQTATNVVVSKYFRGALGTRGRETSVRQMIGRVVDTIKIWGTEGGYFAGPEEVTGPAVEGDSRAEIFHDELEHILLHQLACFNSPVWFNVGIEPEPQCSACFINSVEDTMPSILELAKTEGMLFKYGSGTGSNLSTLRSSKESLSGGGTASGPVSFMKGLDAFAGVIKSGGKTRRAAKMVILNVDHPDIEDFIRCKETEEHKAQALIEAGYASGFEERDGAYGSLFYQNANHSVRVCDEFMQAAVDGGDWSTRAVTDGRPVDTYKAHDLLSMIAEATWTCGDPGMQFDSTINAWHTCPESGPIRASNPCSEFMFLDDSACNLASLNLMRFHDPDRGFDVAGFQHACEVMITAQEILVDKAGYPTRSIGRNSRRFRPLGLGYSNLGALLMARGLPYDSDAGRHLAAAITALMTGTAYAQSARCARLKGPFEGFEPNRKALTGVLRKHRDAMASIGPGPSVSDTNSVSDTDNVAEIAGAARRAWDEAIALAERDGVRNSQVSVLAPTGTIAFMMDCDTTGVEPDIALVKYKKLVDGGLMKIVNSTVPLALERLGYSGEQQGRILAWIEEHDTVEGAPELMEEHLPVFDCALKPLRGQRSIGYSGHLKMLAAVQPFLSGAISKTVNLPEEVAAEEIAEIYVDAWRLGLKAVSIYRDGCKRSQPLRTAKEAAKKPAARGAEPFPARRRLPAERRAITHKFSINQHEGYITVGLYDDGQPGEIFLVMAKEGSTISGLMDGFATGISIALQYGVPLKTLVEKFTHTRFEPSGFTKNPQIPFAKSVTDYIFRWLASKFLDAEDQKIVGVLMPHDAEPAPADPAAQRISFLAQQDAPPCHVCGSIMVRLGSCYECLNCGTTSGCS